MENFKRLIVITSFVWMVVILSINTKITTGFFDSDNVYIFYENRMNDHFEYDVHILYENPEAECSLDKKTYYKMNECNFKLKEGEYTVYIKDDKLATAKEFKIESRNEGEFSSPLDNIDEYYLALNGTKHIDYTFNYPENFDLTRKYSIEDESIISIDGDTIKGLKVGTTNLTVRLCDGNKKKYKITVTDLIQPIELNNNKPYLPCMRYTEEEAHLLDKILESRINEAGYGTRGAVVAAARFITLEFPYQIRYFNENGRLDGHGRPYIDGEGRYYHKGMYLSEDKYKDILKSTASGPKIWGCNIYDQFISKMNMNGFTCSGFVTWVYKNIGFETGDVGAGDFPQYFDDLSDMGPHYDLTEYYMKNGNYKVGDFIGRNGHAALIIGISDDTIYTAESLPPKLKVYIYGRYNSITKHGGNWKSIVDDDNLTYVIEMGNIYPNGEGYYTNMW